MMLPLLNPKITVTQSASIVRPRTARSRIFGRSKSPCRRF